MSMPMTTDQRVSFLKGKIFPSVLVLLALSGAFYLGTLHTQQVNGEMLAESYINGQENIASVAKIVRDADQAVISRQKIEIETLSRYCKK